MVTNYFNDILDNNNKSKIISRSNKTTNGVIIMTNLSLHSRAGTIKVENGNNPRTPYLHQVEAIRALNKGIK